MLIAGRPRGRARSPVAEVCEQLQISEQELREDVDVLNVVNFGGGAYVLYAEVLPNGEIEVDPEPYSDTFDRPARLLPIEAKALVAAIDLIGDAPPRGLARLARARRSSRALGDDPVERGPAGRARRRATTPIIARVVEPRDRTSAGCSSSSTEGRTRTSSPSARVEPYALINGREGWYVAALRPGARTTCATSASTASSAATVLDERFEPRPEVDPVADVEGWPRTGEVEGSRVARVWISPEQARWAREERTVLAELADGAVIVEWAFKGDGLPRARGAQGGRRRRRARARRRARGGAAPPPSGSLGTPPRA